MDVRSLFPDCRSQACTEIIESSRYTQTRIDRARARRQVCAAGYNYFNSTAVSCKEKSGVLLSRLIRQAGGWILSDIERQRSVWSASRKILFSVRSLRGRISQLCFPPVESSVLTFSFHVYFFSSFFFRTASARAPAATFSTVGRGERRENRMRPLCDRKKNLSYRACSRHRRRAIRPLPSETIGKSTRQFRSEIRVGSPVDSIARPS